MTAGSDETPPQDPSYPGGQGWQPPQPDYGQQPGYGQPPPYGQPQTTNGLAIGSLVASILGFLCGVGFVVGLVLGYIARGQIRDSGGTQGGAGLATAGIVIGWIGIGLVVLVFAVLFAFGMAGVMTEGFQGI